MDIMCSIYYPQPTGVSFGTGVHFMTQNPTQIAGKFPIYNFYIDTLIFCMKNKNLFEKKHGSRVP